MLLPTNTNNNCTTTILYNQYARRLASTSKQKKLQGKGKKKRAIAASKHKKRLAATSSSSGNAANSNTNTNKIKKPSKQAPPPPTPTPTAKLEKARHMQTNTLSTNEKEGLLGWFAANPLLFAAVFFPTITMGVVMIFRPEVRPKFLGGDGVSRSAGSKERGLDKVISEQDAPVYEEAAAKEAPVYEQSRRDDEDEKWEMVEAVVEVENEEGNVKEEIVVVETKRGGDAIDLISAIGIRPHSKEKEEDGKETIDLISAIGIRPYSS